MSKHSKPKNKLKYIIVIICILPIIGGISYFVYQKYKEYKEYSSEDIYKDIIIDNSEPNINIAKVKSLQQENEDQYNEYIDNCKKIELYDTETSANYGEQLITLITCEYSQENGRMVVVAKKNT